MQIIGFVLLGFIIWYGFKDRSDAVISAFDAHAMVMVLVGSCSAVLVSSSHTTAWRTILCLRELVPGLALFGRTTRAMEAERDQLSALWRDGKRSQAVDLAGKSRFPAVKQMLELILNRANEASSNKTFTELRHEEISRWQPAIHNWEMLSKLGPAFGMVGTITGMIQLFRNMQPGEPQHRRGDVAGAARDPVRRGVRRRRRRADRALPQRAPRRPPGIPRTVREERQRDRLSRRTVKVSHAKTESGA
ncbi:MotA/TolQ/ExbB proton channel family protein [Archangium gephyra]|uniref:MotA/TolQ/ExbB proton channel family protein n=1 Tax=Archangium gephyra TaxID=48 RepID=UPI003B8067D4